MKHPEFFVCPECGSPELTWAENLTVLSAGFASKHGLRCEGCSREFPYLDGVWVLWSDSVKELHLGSRPDDADVAAKVKWANIQIYEELSEEYGEHHDGIRPYTETVLFLKALATDYQSSRAERGQRVQVEVGCATGFTLERGSYGYDCAVGVDISLANLKAVHARGFVAVLADGESLPFREGSIDLVTIFAALHHLPQPSKFVVSAHRALRSGGVLLAAGEPSAAAMDHRGLGRVVWEGRKPIYRFLSRYSERFYMHRNREQQDLNDIAEFSRTHGGFAPETLEGFMNDAGFSDVKVFHDIDLHHFRRFGSPGWKMFVLKALSLQNPLRRSNWSCLSALGRKSRG